MPHVCKLNPIRAGNFLDPLSHSYLPKTEVTRRQQFQVKHRDAEEPESKASEEKPQESDKKKRKTTKKEIEATEENLESIEMEDKQETEKEGETKVEEDQSAEGGEAKQLKPKSKAKARAKSQAAGAKAKPKAKAKAKADEGDKPKPKRKSRAKKPASEVEDAPQTAEQVIEGKEENKEKDKDIEKEKEMEMEKDKDIEKGSHECDAKEGETKDDSKSESIKRPGGTAKAPGSKRPRKAAGEKDSSEKTFARRRCPKTVFGAAKFEAIKAAFVEDIRPLLTVFSQHEDRG